MISQGPDAILKVLGGLCLLTFLGLGFRRYPLSGVAAVLATHLLDTIDAVPSAQLGSLRISITDLVTLALASATALSWKRRTRFDVSVALIVGLLGLACLRGLGQFDINTVGNSARLLGELVIPTLFGLVVVRQERLPQTQRIWGAAALVLSVSALVFLARFGFGTYDAEGARALNSPQALVVATWALMCLGGPATRRGTLAATAALLLVLVSQQRTVWATTAVGLAAIALNARRAAEPGRRRIAYSIIVGASVGLPLLLLLGPAGFRSSVETAASTVSADSGTFGWRVDGWMDLLRRFRTSDGITQAIGQPMGTGFARTVFGRQMAYSPHNMYLTVLLSLGVVGLVALLLVYGKALLRTRYSRVRPAIWGLVVYSVGYQLTPSIALLLGIALSVPQSTAPSSNEQILR